MKLRRLFGRDDEPQDEPDDARPVDLDEGDAEADVVDEVESPAPADDAPSEPDVVAEAPSTDEAAIDPGPPPDADEAVGSSPRVAAGSSDDVDGDPADEDAEDTDEDADEDEDGAPQQVTFELADWGARERNLLDQALDSADVRRAWEAGTLVVAVADGDVVDQMIDDIEERIALDLVPGVKRVIYDIGEWPPGLEDRFLEELIERRIPHDRGYREIAVAIDDEEQVDALVEAVTTAWEDEEPTEEELDGPDAQEVLSELFVSSDRLLHDATDRSGIVRFDDAATAVVEMGVPFGFDEADWTAITAKVESLRELLSAPETTDSEIVESATELRALLRPLV